MPLHPIKDILKTLFDFWQLEEPHPLTNLSTDHHLTAWPGQTSCTALFQPAPHSVFRLCACHKFQHPLHQHQTGTGKQWTTSMIHIHVLLFQRLHQPLDQALSLAWAWCPRCAAAAPHFLSSSSPKAILRALKKTKQNKTTGQAEGGGNKTDPASEYGLLLLAISPWWCTCHVCCLLTSQIPPTSYSSQGKTEVMSNADRLMLWRVQGQSPLSGVKNRCAAKSIERYKLNFFPPHAASARWMLAVSPHNSLYIFKEYGEAHCYTAVKNARISCFGIII